MNKFHYVYYIVIIYIVYKQKFHKKVNTILFSIVLVISQIFNHPLPVQAVNYLFNNGLLRFDYTNGTAINSNTGNLNQPWYYNSAWYRLTYGSYPLNFAVGVDGDGTNEWNYNGTVQLDPPLTNLTIDNTGLMTNNSLTYGVLKTSGTLTIGSVILLIENSFELGADKSFVKIKTKITNTSSQTATNLRYWVGTQDDYVGSNDQPTKVKGNIINGVFTAIPNTSTKASAIQITSGSEGVLFYTESTTANMSVKGCCSFSNATTADPIASNISTTSDGSYAMYLRLNDLAASASQEFVWYYAAGTTANLSNIVSDVASSSTSAFTNITFGSASFSVTSSVASTGYYLVVPRSSTAPTATQVVAGTSYGSVTVQSHGSLSLTANTATPINITGLNGSTNYDVYFVSQYVDSNNVSQTTAPSLSTFATTAYLIPSLDATSSASSITKTSATLGGNVTSDNSNGTATVSSRGICYSTSSSPSLTNGTCVQSGTGLGTFTTELSGLQSYTTYYARSYATTTIGTGYGDQTSFRTLERTVSINLTGLNSPVTGQTMPSSMSGAGYTGTITWSPTTSDNKFHANVSYAASISLTPSTGYDLNGISANTFTLSGSSSVSHLENSGQITVNYPVTTYDQVIFNSNGGSTVSALDIDYGSSITQPTNPSRNGYTFDGWYTDNNTFQQAFNFQTASMPQGDLNLYAKWAINQYSIIFDSNSGTQVATLTQDAFSNVVEPQEPTRSGYTFTYWSDLSDLSREYTFTTMPTSNQTLYAKWSLNTYTVNYSLDGGTADNPSSYTVETPSIALNPALKTGYTFTTWKDALNNQYSSIPSGSTGNLSLTAVYTINQYDVEFDTNQGSIVNTQTINYHELAQSVSTPTRIGYTFEGWFTARDFSTEFDFSVDRISIDTTLYAKWEPITYLLSFENFGGSSTNPSNYNIETSTILLNPATKPGYTFTGWLDQTSEIVTNLPTGSYGNLSLTATYVLAPYTVQFNTNQGSTIANQIINYQGWVNAVSNPTRLGYQFAGWYKEATYLTDFDFSVDQITSDTTIYAKWNTIQFSISYDYQGGVGSNPTAFTILDVVTLGSAGKEGYAFNGWLYNGQIVTTLPRGISSNVSLIASWKFVPEDPKLGSVRITDVSTDSAYLQGSILELGNPKLTEFGYELVNLSDGSSRSVGLDSQLSAQVSGLNPYTNYSIRIFASNTNTTLYTEAITFQPRLPDTDNDGIPDARDAYPEDASKSFSAVDIQPDLEPARAFIGSKETPSDTQYNVKITEKDVMGLERSDNILVIMGTVQFIIPVTMVDTILANAQGEDTFLTLKVEPQIIEAISSTELLSEADMNVIAAYDYLLFQVYSDGSETPIHELGGQIKVGIGLDQLEGEYDPNKMEVYFYNTETGSIESMKAVYDPATQAMVFMTEHFSYYILGIKKEDDPATATLKVLALGIALGMAIMWFILVGYRKLKEKLTTKKR